MNKYILGVDVGATGTKAAMVDIEAGDLVTEKIKLKTPDSKSPDDMAKVICELVDHFDQRGKPVGIGFPSVIKNGISLTASNIDKKCALFDALLPINKVDDKNPLNKNNHKASGISSLLSQSQRKRVMTRFKEEGGENILVATDVAARGLDIEGVDLVINFELPDDAENYVHRIGRTGRAGEKGKAYSFVSDKDVEALTRIKGYLNREIETEWMEDDELPTDFEPFPKGELLMKRSRNGGGRNDRGPKKGGDRNKRKGKRDDRKRDGNKEGRDKDGKKRRPRRDHDEEGDEKQVHRDKRSGRHRKKDDRPKSKKGKRKDNNRSSSKSGETKKYKQKRKTGNKNKSGKKPQKLTGLLGRIKKGLRKLLK